MRGEPSEKINFLEVYEKMGCNVKASCKARNITRQTFYNWMKSDELFDVSEDSDPQTFKDLVEDIREGQIDQVESLLMNQIIDGNMTGIIFYLKTRGKHRGYIEGIEIKNTKAIENAFEGQNEDQIYEQLQNFNKELEEVLAAEKS